MELVQFIAAVKANKPINFNEVMAIIEEHYHYAATTFKNGELTNEQGTNEGSCKIFAFARLHDLNQQQTLSLFGDFYQDVLQDPQGEGHQNIRQFMLQGWQGIDFGAEVVLTPK